MYIKEIQEILEQNYGLTKHLKRLRGITGLISILGQDSRIHAFNRYDHVMRVACITSWFCDRFKDVDRKAAIIIALSHDINRLPFAHNLEEYIGFDQAANIESYLAKHECSLANLVVLSIKDTLNKNPNGTHLSRLVYAADSVAGFIEDPLLFLTALGFEKTFIPQTVCEELGFDFNDSNFVLEIQDLADLIHEDVSQYVIRFNELVFRLSTRFADMHNDQDLLFIDKPQFPALREKLKNNFLRSHLHPWNNEKISQGTRLAREVGIPFMDALRAEGRNPIAELLDMTDTDLLIASFERGLINSLESYYPCLPHRKERRKRCL